MMIRMNVADGENSGGMQEYEYNLTQVDKYEQNVFTVIWSGSLCQLLYYWILCWKFGKITVGYHNFFLNCFLKQRIIE